MIMIKNDEFRHWNRYLDVLIFNRIDSTNDEAKRLLDANYLTKDSLIWAETQTNGRGRLSRKWDSQAGNLFFTIVLKDLNMGAEILPSLNLLAAVTLGELIKDNFNVDFSYKWPNDLLLNSKKLAGTLIESKFNPFSQLLDWVIIGVGINVISHPGLTNYPATSFFAEGITISNGDLLDQYLQKFLFLKSEMLSYNSFDYIKNKWNDHAAFIGEVIEINLSDKKISGKFYGIDDNGNVKLELPNGEIEIIQYGDIFLK